MPYSPITLLKTEDASVAPNARQADGILDRGLLVIVSLILTTMIGIVLWGLNRGLDLCDEGYYLLMTSSPQEYVAPTSFPFVLSKLPNITGSLVINLRLFQLISQLVSSTVLALGFWRLMSSVWFKPTKIQLYISIAFTILGSFLLQSIFPPDISYNGLTYFFAFSSLGLLFAGSAHMLNGWRGGGYLMAAAGFLSGFIFSVKFSACMSTTALALLWFVLNIKRRIAWQYYILGLVIAPIVFLCFFQTPLQLKEQVCEIIRFASIVKVFSPIQQMQTYGSDIVFTLSTIWHGVRFYLFVPMLAVILAEYMTGRAKSIFRLLSILSIAPVFLLARFDLSESLLVYPIVYAAILLCLSVILVFMVINSGEGDAKAARPNRLAAPSIILLFLLPFACSIGTSNPIMLQATTCLAPVFLALSALSIKAFPNFYSSAYRFALMGGLSVVVFLLFLHGYVAHPYLLRDSLIDQKCDSSNLTNLRGIKLAPEAHQFLTSTSTILKKGGFRPGDPILALYNMPGVVYAVGGTAPSFAWLFSTSAFENFRPIWFHDIRNRVKERLFLLTSWEPALKTQRSLQKADINFPNQFELLGAAQMKPYVDGCGPINWGAGDHYLGGEVRVYKWNK